MEVGARGWACTLLFCHIIGFEVFLALGIARFDVFGHLVGQPDFGLMMIGAWQALIVIAAAIMLWKSGSKYLWPLVFCPVLAFTFPRDADLLIFVLPAFVAYSIVFLEFSSGDNWNFTWKDGVLIAIPLLVFLPFAVWLAESSRFAVEELSAINNPEFYFRLAVGSGLVLVLPTAVFLAARYFRIRIKAGNDGAFLNFATAMTATIVMGVVMCCLTTSTAVLPFIYQHLMNGPDYMFLTPILKIFEALAFLFWIFFCVVLAIGAAMIFPIWTNSVIAAWYGEEPRFRGYRAIKQFFTKYSSPS